MKWFMRRLARAVAEEIVSIEEEKKWVNQHKQALIRAKAVAHLECPEKVNDYEYLKSTIENKE